MTNYTARLKRGANIRFGLAAAIALIAAIFLIWPNYRQLSETRAGIADLDSQMIDAELELEAERNEYRLLKNEYSLSAATDEGTIVAILPETSKETEIARELERKANELSGDNDSLILESVTIGKASNKKEVDYLELPIKISVIGSKEKILAFLRYLEKTGTVTDGEQAARLIDVQNVSLQIKNRGSQTNSTSNEINVDIAANAYVLPTPEEIAASKAAKN
ncbi:MAG: hypothetical protein K9L85_02490 [Candidatus Peribacteraceae bacterium]|nr:hypothetical protein [Candidatus Peribacteraceae bacterium]